MRFFVLSILAATAAIVLATGATASGPDAAAKEGTTAETAGMMPSGPLFGPLAPEEVAPDPVAVPEPVWASVLAACAVSLLRRGRR